MYIVLAANTLGVGRMFGADEASMQGIGGHTLHLLKDSAAAVVE